MVSRVEDGFGALMVERGATVGWSFERVYDQELDFVWRNARRLGVERAELDDVIQEVFVIVHRRLGEVAERANLRGWVLAILFGVVKNQRRARRRKPLEPGALDPEQVEARDERGPEENAARLEAARALFEILCELDEPKREVFVLAELEELTAAEIAVATASNVNTVYARLRAARREFGERVARRRASDGWRVR